MPISIVVLSRAFTDEPQREGRPPREDRADLRPGDSEPAGDRPVDRERPGVRLLCMGNIGHSQGLAPLVAAFDRAGLPGDRVRLVSRAPGSPRRTRPRRCAKDAVEMVGLSTRSGSSTSCSRRTSAFVTQHYEGGEFNIPSKLMNYMVYGLPVLAAVNPTGEVAALVRESGRRLGGRQPGPDAFPAGRLAPLIGRRRSATAGGRRAATPSSTSASDTSPTASTRAAPDARPVGFRRARQRGSPRRRATVALGERPRGRRSRAVAVVHSGRGAHLVVDPRVSVSMPSASVVDGSQPQRSRIIVLSLVRPRTPFGASRLYRRSTSMPAISSTMSTSWLIGDHLAAAEVDRLGEVAVA